MVKGKGGGTKRSKGGGGGGPVWTGADHAFHNEERQKKKLKKQQKKAQREQKDEPSAASNTDPTVVAETPTTTTTTTSRKRSRQSIMAKRQSLLQRKQLERQVVSTHESAERKEDMRLKLHLSKTKRQLATLKQQLENWDTVERQEMVLAKKKEAEKAAERKEHGYRRKGPETWKLKGAARPAWQVYDFDTRYVDPHIQAHADAKVKAQRTQNILAVYKGRFGQLASARENPDEDSEARDDSAVPSLESCAREYLSLLMQLGHLSVEAKQFASARKAWLECLELEGDDKDHSAFAQKDAESTNPQSTPQSPITITSARESLMRLYLQLQKQESAWRLGSVRLSLDTSVWIRYSTAWVAIQSLHSTPTSENKEEAIIQEDDAQVHLVRAIKSNVFCAYYLAFFNVFDHVMEYTDEIEEHSDGPQSSLEEAIEYCSAKLTGRDGRSQAARWMGPPQEALRTMVLQARAGNHKQLTASDLAWEDRLTSIEQEYASRIKESGTESSLTGGKESTGTDDEDDGGDSDEYAERGDGMEEPFDEEEPMIDVAMYAGMFRTAMDMVEEEGLLRVSPS